MSPSLRGHLLIAVPKLRDPNFFKSVVLLVEHGTDGAMGLIVNRPSSITVANALQGHFHLSNNSDLVFTGGPVEPVALFLIHNCGELDPEESAVVDGLYMGSSAAAFERVLQSQENCSQPIEFRIYAGCAGWGPGQLEGELQRGDWLTLPASREMVLAEDPYEVWDRARLAVQAAHRLLELDCDHPELN
jgi:putative transcriptional regulator